jgi:HK97 family phage major capsid protein
MKITQALREWHVKNGASAEASDGEIAALTMDALLNDKLSQAELKQLTVDTDGVKGASLLARLELLAGGTETPETPSEKPATAPYAKKAPRFDKVFGEGDPSRISSMEELFQNDGALVVDKSGCMPRVKSIKERFNNDRKEAFFPEQNGRGKKHPMAGQRAIHMENGFRKEINHASEFEKKIHNAFFKMLIESATDHRDIPHRLKMTEEDNHCLTYAFHEVKWGGTLGDFENPHTQINGDRLTDRDRKAIIDDSGTGGINIAPITFDEAIIQTPLLFGEFFPSVNVVPVNRGRRVEGGTISNVTMNSSGAQGDASTITLETTASFIGSFNTNIFVVDGAIELGLDFLSDTPIDVTSILIEQYGRVLMVYLDEQIAIGDGTTEPEGIMVASGTTNIATTNGNTGPPTVGDYEGLMFGVGKAFKQGHPMNRILFGGSETSYQRVRGIAVGTTDQRRVFGMDEESYELFEHPYGVGGGLANTQLFFGVMPRYRMYKRLGLQILTTTEGKELTLDNLLLITARARYGGQIEDGSAFAVSTDAQT